MPTYVYHCDSCDAKFEAVQKFADDPLTSCPEGHGPVRRVITPSAIIFKGSGWYVTDSKNGGASVSKPKSDDSPAAVETSDKATPKSETAESPKPEPAKSTDIKSATEAA
jgi:putative FmdB family regulatory protein